MRFLYHLRHRGEPLTEPYAPDSLTREGFVHCSYRDRVVESAALYFPEGAELEALQIDPRRLDVPVVVAETPRGPMPHIHGAIPRDAVRQALALDAVLAAADEVTATRFGFVAFEGMTLLDLVGMLDPITRIASMGVDPDASFEVFSATRAPSGPVFQAFGATLSVTRHRPALDEFDVLLVPGGHGTRALERDAEVIAWLASYPQNRLVASVCTGALLLGAAGVLRGKRATTHHSERSRLFEYGAEASNERVVDEGRVVTAGGVTCALDLGLHLVTRLHGDAAAARIRAQIELV